MGWCFTFRRVIKSWPKQHEANKLRWLLKHRVFEKLWGRWHRHSSHEPVGTSIGHGIKSLAMSRVLHYLNGQMNFTVQKLCLVRETYPNEKAVALTQFSYFFCPQYSLWYRNNYKRCCPLTVPWPRTKLNSWKMSCFDFMSSTSHSSQVDALNFCSKKLADSLRFAG